MIAVTAGDNFSSARYSLSQFNGSLVGLASAVNVIDALEIVWKYRCKKLCMKNLRRLNHLSVNHKVSIIFHLLLNGLYHLPPSVTYITYRYSGNKI